MQLIATARFQAAFQRAVATRPYSDKLAELVGDLSRAAGSADHPLLKTNDSDRSALVVISSNRGLCGGYNANVLRTAVEHLGSTSGAHHVHMVGKKGTSYFRFLGREIHERTLGIDDRPRFEQVEPIAYPFDSHAGDVTFTQPSVGNRELDFNTEGLVHIGMLPELIQDARADAEDPADLDPLFRSAEGYIRMWEKAEARKAALGG